MTRCSHAGGRFCRQPDARKGGGSRRAVLVVMCVGYFLVLFDVTIVNVALPRIGSGLHTSVSGLQWVVDGYALALASLIASRAR
jgi:DHA2 family methylenomycin A resistance protein-like MFS transporter